VFLFIIVTPFHRGEWSAQSVILVVGVDALGILLLLALYKPDRFHWAGRAATGLVFLAFLSYLIDEIVSGHPWHFGPRSEPSPLNALLGLFAIGVPCLRYTLVGRFGRKPNGTPMNLWLTGPCGLCPKPLSEHDWAMFASTVASKENMPRLKEFFEKVKEHDWRSVATFNDFDATEDDVLVYAVRCESGGSVAVVRSPFELYENDELYLRETVTPDEMSVIERLIPSTSWRHSEFPQESKEGRKEIA
jgi:hypothetical protein